MGAPKKWFKAFLGLRRSDRSQSADKDCSESTSASNGRKHSAEVSGVTVENELNDSGDNGDAKGVNTELFTGSVFSPSSSPVVQNAAQPLGYTREEWAVRKIQAAVTRFLSSNKIQNRRKHSADIDSGVLEHGVTKLEDANDANLEPVSVSCKSSSASHQISGMTDDFRHQMGCTVEPGIENGLDQYVIGENEAAVTTGVWLVADSASSISQSPPVPNASQVHPSMSQEHAATQIQRAFRHFVSRKRLRALKGLVRLQGLIRDHAVRKQAAATLHCMQSVVRVQASVQARSFRMALGSQTVQQKHQDQVEPEVDAKETEVRYQESQTEQQKSHNQLDHEVHVKETEDGWCDSVGSAEQIQAKLLKRKEAAAKREKAKAYALARQWQARPREQVASAVFQTDNSNWSWNWLDRWMSFRPWENRMVDVNLNSLMQSHDSKPVDDAHGAPAAHSVSIMKKPISKMGSGKMSPRSSNNADISNGQKVVPHPGGSSSSTIISSGKTQQKPRALVSSKSLKSVSIVEIEGATSKSKLSSRSRSTPKERVNLTDKEKINPKDKQGKKRLSLPGNGLNQGAQTSRQPIRTAVKRSPTAPRPTKAKPKPDVNDIKPSPLSQQTAH